MINPIAGMGGAVGLHGTDAGIHIEAAERGAIPISSQRAGVALSILFNSSVWSNASSEIEFLTPQGAMGGDLLQTFIDKDQINKKLIKFISHDTSGKPGSTSATDTKTIAKIFSDRGVDLILFAGGDGTARDIFEVIQDSIPILGIPAGVKMRSGVFALYPAKAGELLGRILSSGAGEKPVIRTQDAEILDLNEDSSDYSSSEFFGVAKTPYAPDLIQRSKSASSDSGAGALEELAIRYANTMKHTTLYLVGPGGSSNRILKALGLSLSPRGVHAIQGGKCIGEDIGEREIAQLVARNSECELVVGVIGGQGYLFGRGNQQLSAAVIEAIGWSRIFIVASAEKLLELMPTELHMDFNQPLRNPPPSFLQVHTSISRTVVCRLLYQVASPSTSMQMRS